MQTWIALLRAINVGGTGKLTMAALKGLCEELGYVDVRTYIQSGNVIFRTADDTDTIHAALTKALAHTVGKPVAVMLRHATDLDDVVDGCPWPDAPGNQVIVIYLPTAPKPGSVDEAPGPDGEVVVVRGREIYVHFPNGQGRSKLKLPLLTVGTGRNLNTTRKLASLARTVGAVTTDERGA